MIAVAFLPPIAVAQLRRALPSPHRIWSASSWNEFIDHVNTARGDVIVVDPCTDRERDGARRVHALAAALEGRPSAPVIGYVSVTAAAIHAVHALVRAGAADIVVRGADDTAGGLATAIHRAAASSLATRLIHYLGDPFARLPPALGAACHALFARPELTPCVDDLASQARMTRRSLDRWLARSGLAPARRLLACARINAAFHLIVAASMRPSRAATFLGYPSPRALARELHRLTGFTPSALARTAAPDAFLAALAPRLLRDPRGLGVRSPFAPRPEVGGVEDAVARREASDAKAPSASGTSPPPGAARVFERPPSSRRGRTSARRSGRAAKVPRRR